MRAVFVVPEINLAGGTKVILEYAAFLMERGHEVSCIMPRSKERKLRSRLSRMLKGRRTDPRRESAFFPIATKLNVIEGGDYDRVHPSELPDAEVVIATWWETAEWVETLPSSKGVPVHFVQDHEVFEYLPVERVRQVYRKPMPKLVVSRWLNHIMEETYGAPRVHLVQNGVDTERFRPERAGERQFDVGFVWSSTPRKNAAMAIEALALARERLPGFTAVVFGSEPCPPELLAVSGVRYHERPDQALIPELYASSKLWLFPSHTEGFGLPVLEALASGTPVVATRAGAAPDLIDASNGWLIDCDPARMAAALVDFLGLSAAEQQRMSEAARQTGLRSDWRASAHQFEAALASEVELALAKA